MKKILLATTVLAMSAGVAAAEVKISGDGWMGVTNNSAATADKTQFKSRARVTFGLSGDTGAGITFGGSLRADNAGTNGVTGGGAVNGTAGSVFVSGDFGRVAMGDVDSALEATWFRTRHIGVLENAGGSRATALGAGTDPAALYTINAAGLDIALGAAQPQDVLGDQYSAGVKFKVGDIGVAGGFEKLGTTEHWLLSGQAAVAGFTVNAFYGERTAAATAEQYGLDASTSFDGIGVLVRVKRDFAEADHLGLGVTYALGGGATVGASINNVNPKVGASSSTADFGVAFRF